LSIPAPSRAVASERFRILVVDDNSAIHDDFKKILCPEAAVEGLSQLESELFGDAPASERQQSFEIVCVDQGQSAIDEVQRSCDAGRPYALAFVDVRMPPGLNGIETIAGLWKIDPSLQAVICTAYSDHTWNDIVRSLGQSDGLLILRKPFDPIEVQQLSHALTNKWRLSRIVRRQLQDLELLVDERTANLRESNDNLRREIEFRVRVERELKHLATHDPLTGLPNRLLLSEQLTQAMARARRNDCKVGLLLLDLDHFKDINDCYGHAAGDELLRVVSERLKGCLRANDTVARMGGDEFVVLLDELESSEGAALVAQRFIDACNEPVMAGGKELITSPSVGIALYPDDGSEVEHLLKAADLAMYQAKSAGRASFRYYAQGMLASSLEKVELRDQLSRAVERNELGLWYQPLIDPRNGRVAVVEALLRWRHPKLGLVPPLKFIPLAEKTGQIVPVGTWVLKDACRQLAVWRAQGFLDLAVAVNVSAAQVQSPDFVTLVQNALATSELPPELLHLEITETAAMHDLEGSTRLFHELAQMGVRIVIDDFGSGYSSLVRLKQLPIHSLKIDQFFIKDIIGDPRDAAIVSAIVTLAHSLGLSVVAEGVETIEQLEYLRGLDQRVEAKCDLVQGFLLGKPLPADAMTTLLNEYATRAAEISGIHISAERSAVAPRRALP
jgi:diguanylate cyclase